MSVTGLQSRDIDNCEDLLEEVLCSGPEHEFFVDLHVELGPLGLELAATCCSAGIGALEKNRIKCGILIFTIQKRYYYIVRPPCARERVGDDRLNVWPRILNFPS